MAHTITKIIRNNERALEEARRFFDEEVLAYAFSTQKTDFALTTTPTPISCAIWVALKEWRHIKHD